MTLETLQQQLQDIHNVIRMAKENAREGKYFDLETIRPLVEATCNGLTHLPREEAKQFLPALSSIIQDLNEAAASLKETGFVLSGNTEEKNNNG